MKFKLLLLFALSCTTWQMILRLPCGDIFADFTIFIKDKALNGSVIATINNTNEVQCMVKCVEHHKCRSYNAQNDEKKCELNSKAIGEKDTVLISKPGWMYKSTDYNDTQIGNTCQELNPCPTDILCRDKCDYPFYECVYCDESHYGLHCDKLKDLNECSHKPCKNNATCVDLKSRYFCQCVPGFSGVNCETDIDECDSLPCINGGECIDEVGNYRCQCAPGYEGKNCEKDVDECLSQPCQNDGKCKNHVNKFLCECKAGFVGAVCELDFDECSSNPCKNGAACVNGANKFTCTCLTGYSGTLCHPECGTAMTGDSGEIISKNYPAKYPKNHDCQWTVKVAVGSRVHVVFNDFAVEVEDGICYDYVRLYDGPLATSSPLSGKLCGLGAPSQTTVTNQLVVQLISDNIYEWNGFNLTWTVQP